MGDGLPWFDAVALGIGAALALAALLPVVAWQRWRLGKLASRAAASRAEARGLLECLATSPDGFYCWSAAGPESCSRRLAVLLGLPRGLDSDFAEVIAAFAPEDGLALENAVERLRSEGDGFEGEYALAAGERKVRVLGVRAVGPDGEVLADLVWMRDVSEGASVVDDLARSLQALAADTAYLKALIDALPMPVWLRDEDLSLLAVNRAYAAAVDAAGPEAVVHAQVELAPDALVREARALAARARAAGEPRSESFHLVLGGERRLVQVTEVPVSVGDTLLTAGLIHDQTRVEELRAELDHHVSAQAEVLERLATAIAIFTTDTRLAFFNTAFARLWRLDREWLGSQPTYGAVMDALRERRLLPEAADYRAYKEEELKRFISLIDPIETLMHLPDGRTLRRLVSPHPYGGLIFTYEDVTDTLALERSFNTAMAVQRETLDHLHEGIAVFGGDGRLKLSNPAFGRIWDLTPEDLAGEPHASEIVERLKPFFEGRPDRASTWPAARERLVRLVGDRASTDGRLDRQDGAILACTSVPLPDGAILLTFLDVTDTARVERALIERNEALAAADTLKSEFIANVSAEVAKPLTTVIGFAEMLSAEYFGKLSKRQHDYVKGIGDAGQALKALVSDILDLAAIEAGQMTLELDSVDLHPLLSSVLGLVRERVREKKLTLDFACPLDIGWIVADQRRLKQVMFNLVGNAVKFTPNGGAITVGAARDGAEVILTVTDSGPGISPEDQARVFDSFVRTAPDTGQGGAGLGLALVRRFVELHGGRVELKSLAGQGTTVTIRLPVGV
ncbi:PAS domain-containing sensor histidine kinase [Magnetospirillum sp. UT-4]|uniref:sensor histidine kinase n=1 Tax=Magnetospirillum sp. UT-4 TaxID=2681467 RepID=UPI0013822B67|nr:PAS domain-containing sensor histidine kinase [Magnetospirillum sp. UT-4]CAA7621598.1 putative histidine kinase protein [Magnetospirillum sp. UT-4]